MQLVKSSANPEGGPGPGYLPPGPLTHGATVLNADGSMEATLAKDGATPAVWRCDLIPTVCAGPLTVPPGGVVTADWVQELTNDNWSGGRKGWHIDWGDGSGNPTLLMVATSRMWIGITPGGQSSKICPAVGTNWDCWRHHEIIERHGSYQNTGTTTKQLYVTGFLWLAIEDDNVVPGYVPQIRLEPAPNYSEIQALVLP